MTKWNWILNYCELPGLEINAQSNYGNNIRTEEPEQTEQTQIINCSEHFNQDLQGLQFCQYLYEHYQVLKETSLRKHAYSNIQKS